MVVASWMRSFARTSPSTLRGRSDGALKESERQDQCSIRDIVDLDQCSLFIAVEIFLRLGCPGRGFVDPCHGNEMNCMASEQLANTAAAPLTTSFADPNRGTVANFEGELTRNRLREALAQEEAPLREKDAVIRMLFAGREFAATYIARLTPRERLIMELVLAGYRSKDIAADLGISRRTFENHRAAIMRKTGTNSLPALTRLALAASWNGAVAPTPSAELRNMGEPEHELITSTAR
jgi:DNA-binding CsgD family transcriptional regulator